MQDWIVAIFLLPASKLKELHNVALTHGNKILRFQIPINNIHLYDIKNQLHTVS